jgi:hypothetical protein
MNKPRATVGIAIVFLAAALSLAGIPHGYEPGAFAGDPSVPSASEALRETKTASQGNVVDMTY